MKLKDICFISSLSFCNKVGPISDVVSSDNFKTFMVYLWKKTLPLVMIMIMMIRFGHVVMAGDNDND